jgi:predicted nucleic-acid-binding protein
MNGVESFVSHNFSEHDSTFYSCLHLIVYGYSLLEQSKKYSRKNIRKLTSTIRRKETNKVELEDFLRNDLVENYIEPIVLCLVLIIFYLFRSGRVLR